MNVSEQLQNLPQSALLSQILPLFIFPHAKQMHCLPKGYHLNAASNHGIRLKSRIPNSVYIRSRDGFSWSRGLWTKIIIIIKLVHLLPPTYETEQGQDDSSKHSHSEGRMRDTQHLLVHSNSRILLADVEKAPYLSLGVQLLPGTSFLVHSSPYPWLCP